MTDTKKKLMLCSSPLIKKSAKKLKFTCDLIRGLTVQNAILKLKFSKKKESNDIIKTISSAISNAENNYGYKDISMLKISQIIVNQKRKLKRILIKGRGRTGKMNKKYSIIKIGLDYIENKV
ncbi:uL22m family ribosomal protein [Lyticum sinuosum]|uniref:50S ribosomal protein L22 n=1 Tax=Lyticum sinuosum TaxID=1332059 RepID=A0AAE4VJI9_9RICK|nr:uL22 family ribosomal protein [Lyticum sinuosum]MDZ5761185.1 50S ribosomal protein L22 [Lyticum sinuosum]